MLVMGLLCEQHRNLHFFFTQPVRKIWVIKGKDKKQIIFLNIGVVVFLYYITDNQWIINSDDGDEFCFSLNNINFIKLEI